MLPEFASLFSRATPRSDYGRREYLWLALLLAVGVVLRFWGLGNVGLFGDEETMAMATLAILETGLPYLPSGMFYPRGLGQLYLMAVSLQLFGVSEWALRLPSALCGVVGVLAAFFVGKRFLTPRWNLAFVAVVAMLPGLVETSMVARMYIFLSTLLLIFAAAVFRWEKTGRPGDLALAFVAYLAALLFHSLAVFGSLLFLFPGLSRGSWRQLGAGAAAVVAAFGALRLVTRWTASKYPPDPDIDLPPATDRVDAVALFAADHTPLMVAAFLAGLAVVALAARPGRGQGLPARAALTLYVGAVVAAVLLQYHAAALLFVAATIIGLRQVERWDHRQLGGIALIAAFIACLAAVQLYLLAQTGLFPGRRILGALVGYPSVWPMIRFSEYSIGGVAFYLAALGFAFFMLARRNRIPDHFLLFALAVWLPFLLLGFLRWDVELRYTFGMLPFFALCAVAGGQYLVAELGLEARRLGQYAIPSALLVLIVNPLNLARAANPSYGRYPDHKGAAEFVKSLDLTASDILVAEDVLQQTYYLGKVDYWLASLRQARNHLEERDSRIVDQYTATPLLSSAEDLQALLDGRGHQSVYVIGSGENFANGRRTLRDTPVDQILESGQLEVVYSGRDGKTKVWRAAPLQGRAYGQ